MKITSKSNGNKLNNVKLNKVEELMDLNIPEAGVETLFETYLETCGWGTIGRLYTKRNAKNLAYDTFPSKTGAGIGEPDYILYEDNTSYSKIIAIGDVKSPKNSNSEEGLKDCIEKYVKGYNELHEHKIRIAFGYDGVDFKIKYLRDIEKNIWEDIFIDDYILQELPSPDFMKLINKSGNYFTTDIKKNVAKEMLEPFFAKCDSILRHTKLSSSPIDKAIEVSIFIFLKIFSMDGLDEGFRKMGVGKSVWESVERGQVDLVNKLFIEFLNKKYADIFPDRLISIEKDDAIKLAEIINIMFDKCDIHKLTDVKGNAMEYFQKDSKDKKIGEFFTPRHIVDLIVYLTNPVITFKKHDNEFILDRFGNRVIDTVERIYDPACGSGGFLIQSFNMYLEKYSKYGVSAENLEKNIIFGTELKEKTVMLTKLNMILLGDGHNNIVRNSSISYMTTEKLIRIKKGNKYIEVDSNKIIKINRPTKFGMLYTYCDKDTNQPVIKVESKVKYYLGKKDDKTKKINRVKKNSKFVPIEQADVISKEVNTNNVKEILYFTKSTNEPVVKVGENNTKYYLAEIKLDKDGIPEKEYVNIKAVNEEVRKEHSPFFGKFDIVMANHPYGLEEPNRPDELFLKHMLASLKSGGRIGCVVGETFLFHRNYLQIRKDILKKYTVESIISLPQGVFWPYTDVKTSILLIKKEKPIKGHKTWLVEISNDGFELTPTRDTIDEDDIPQLKNLWVQWGGYLRNFNGEQIYESYHREEKGFAEFHDLDSKNWCVKRYNIPKSGLKSGYDLVPINEILFREKDSITIQKNKKYKRITIQVENRGIILRDEEYGHNIGTKKQFKVKSGQFIISKIDARYGAYGILPNELDSAIITGNFWAFDINKDKIVPEYLTYLMRHEHFLNMCNTCSYGSTNRWYLDEDTFNNYKIPLSSKAIQEEILNKIKKHNNDIEKAKQDIVAAENSIKNIINNIFK